MSPFLLLGACAWLGDPAPRDRPAPKTDAELSGYSGQYNDEAERAFAEARVLWKRQLSSLADAEVCTDPAKAVSLLDKSIALEPEYMEAYARRGLAKSELGEREAAFDDLTAAIRLRPLAENYAYRALVSIRADDPRAAKRDLEYSLKLDDSQSRAHNFLGVLALRRDDAQGACAAFDAGCSNGDCTFLEAARQEAICQK